MTHALRDVRARHSSAPLFDDQLTQQLNAYQDRAAAVSGSINAPAPYSATNAGGPFRPVSRSNGASPARASSLAASALRDGSAYSGGGSGPWRQATAQLPPEIQRPAAVEWLLSFSAGRGGAGASGPGASGAGAWSASLSVEPLGINQQPSFDAQGYPLDDDGPADPSSYGRSASRSRRRRGSVSHQYPDMAARRSTYAADSDDDEGAVADTDKYVTRRDSDGGGGLTRSRDQSRREAANKRRGKGGDQLATDDDRTSRRPQAAAERRSGPPTAAGSGRTSRRHSDDDEDTASRRTDTVAPEEWAWRKLENIDENIARALARRGIQRAMLREVGQVPPHTKVTGGSQTDLVIDAKDRPVVMTRTDVGDLRLVDEAAAVYQARMQRMEQHHPSNRTPPTYLLAPMVPIRNSDDVAAASSSNVNPDTAAVEAAAGLRSGISARGDLHRRLDQLRLADEELVMSHAREVAADHPMYDEALHDVAVANRETASGIVPAPVGGYGSVSDGTYDGGVQQQSADAYSRWHAAKVNSMLSNEARTAPTSAAASVAALRKYGSDHAQASEKRVQAPEVQYRRGQGRDNYDARKKWGNVDFGVSNDPDEAADQQERREFDFRVSVAEQRRRDAARDPSSFDETKPLPVYGTDHHGAGFVQGRSQATLDTTHHLASTLYPASAAGPR